MTEPGWYADPSGMPDSYRWWDGTSWTRWLADRPDVGAPEAAQAPGGVATATATTPDPGPAPAIGPDPQRVEPEHEQLAIRLPIAAGITIGAVILAVILLGVTVSVTADRLPSGPPVDPPPKQPADVVALYDLTSGEYVAGPVRMKVPGAPYDCADYAAPVRSGVETGFKCTYDLHPNYRDGWTWQSDTGFGVLPDSMVDQDDLKGTARRVLGQLGSRGYEGVKLLNPKFKAEPLTGITEPPDEALIVTGTFGYRVPKLPSTGARITFVVIKLEESGKHVVFYTDVPDDAPEEVVAAADAALKSLTAR